MTSRYYLGLDVSTQSLTAIVIEYKNDDSSSSSKVVFSKSINFEKDLPEYGCVNGVVSLPRQEENEGDSLLSSSSSLIRHSDPLMWVAALDKLFSSNNESDINNTSFDWSKVNAICGSAQQHGSVYLNKNFFDNFLPSIGSSSASSSSSSQLSLAEKMKPCLSRLTSPIWMDSSTTKECQEIALQVASSAKQVVITTSDDSDNNNNTNNNNTNNNISKDSSTTTTTTTASSTIMMNPQLLSIGNKLITEITGSAPTERFTGPQIRKFFKEHPEDYTNNTSRIHLVSSFFASILSGLDAPVDIGDGAGMNLLNLRTGEWEPSILEATAPDLINKLPQIHTSSSTTPFKNNNNTIAQYFVENYNFNKECCVFPFTGDNPASLVGMGGDGGSSQQQQQQVPIISLGTSDVFITSMVTMNSSSSSSSSSSSLHDPNGYGHVFGDPSSSSSIHQNFMALSVFKNGSLAREEVMRRCGLKNWDEFSAAIRKENDDTPFLLLLPFFQSEITPRILNSKVLLVVSSSTNKNSEQNNVYDDDDFAITNVLDDSQQDDWWKNNASVAARAIVETQALSMRLHSSWMMTKKENNNPKTIRVTGGASKNNEILKIIGDVFNVQTVERIEQTANSAALGAAILAAGRHLTTTIQDEDDSSSASVIINNLQKELVKSEVVYRREEQTKEDGHQYVKKMEMLQKVLKSEFGLSSN